MKTFAPETPHEVLLRSAPRTLAFRPELDFARWRQALDGKLRELLGWMPERVAPNLRIEYEQETDAFHEIRFLFTTEAHADVPCHLLVPTKGAAPFPVVICLQGHSSGMHNSLARPKFPGDEEAIRGGDRDFAIQAVREGYAALVLEQRCFGEREDRRPAAARSLKNRCHHATMTALLLGRTMIGERVWDVCRAIDLLAHFPRIDPSRIGCMGNSGGGTITYYATCLEPRIGIAMPSCSVCTLADSIGAVDHCADNYLPRMLQYFDMGDLAGLIAPRPLVVVAGREDRIFPLHGVEEAFACIRQIYEAAGVPDRCRLVIGEGGHRFYAREAWPVFRELSGW